MNIYQTLKGALLKDVANENETKQCAVMIRLSCLTMAFYFVCLAIVFLVLGRVAFSLCALISIVLYYSVMHLTYINRTYQAYYAIIPLTIFVIVMQVVLYGWWIGAQHFLFPLLVFTFLANYTKWGHKIGLALLYCATRLGLYFFTQMHAPLYNFSGEQGDVLQIVNTVCIMFQLCALIACTSMGTQEMERKLVKYNKKVEKLARLDTLTGLPNRRYAEERLKEILEDSDKSKGFVNVAIGDIDFFKKVNDTYGHDAGDSVLASVASICKNELEGHGYVARWGGEEFLFVINGMNGDEAYVLLDNLRQTIQDRVIVHNAIEIQVTLTFGLEEYNDAQSFDDNIKKADEKLYQGKQNGRNQVVY